MEVDEAIRQAQPRAVPATACCTATDRMLHHLRAQPDLAARRTAGGARNARTFAGKTNAGLRTSTHKRGSKMYSKNELFMHSIFGQEQCRKTCQPSCLLRNVRILSSHRRLLNNKTMLGKQETKQQTSSARNARRLLKATPEAGKQMARVEASTGFALISSIGAGIALPDRNIHIAGYCWHTWLTRALHT